MNEPDQLLDVLQADLVALLQNVPALSDAYVFTGTEKDLATRLKKTFSTRTDSADGKHGLGIQVLPIFIPEAESNLPGPPLKLKIQILAIENVKLNRNADHGTGKTTSQAALQILGALQLQSIGAHSIYADATPIAPEKVDDGFEAHLVTLYTRANGLQGPGKVLGVSPEITEAEGGNLIVSGPLSPDVTGTLPAFAEGVGWSDTGTATPDNGYPFLKVVRELNGKWHLSLAQSLFSYGGWMSDVVEEGVMPWEATGWAPYEGNFVTTGVPSFALSSGASLIALNCATSGAAIYYTTDGTYPTPENGTLYSAPFTEPDDGTLVRAAAYKAGLNPGDCLEFTITE